MKVSGQDQQPLAMEDQLWEDGDRSVNGSSPVVSGEGTRSVIGAECLHGWAFADVKALCGHLVPLT